MSLTQHTYQIWTNNKSNGFTLSLSGSLPPNAGQVSFADMDRDGTIDMVFPTCQQVDKGTGIGTDCAINVAYNVQKKLCQAKVSGWGGLSGGANDTAEEGKCRKPDDLCEADEAYKFNFDNANPEVWSYFLLVLT
jgi:integrin alpha FG-GAP repeat containing protein 1